MGITANPFGVGASGQDFVQRNQTCECCGLVFLYWAPRRDPSHRRWCPDCVAHKPAAGETREQLVERLQAHEPGLRSRMEDAREAANRAEQQANSAKEQTAAALRSRDRAQGMLYAVVEAHVEARNSRCSCGQPYPCTTVRAMNNHDPGYARRLVELMQARLLDEDGSRGRGPARNSD